MDAVEFIQSQDVAHRDIKTENILLDNNFNIKIADFGFATGFEGGKLNSFGGTKLFMAPEIHNLVLYDGKKSDIFALGIVLFIMVEGIFPFTSAQNDELLYSHIKNGDSETYWKLI